MIYSVSLLHTKADCKSLLDKTRLDRKDKSDSKTRLEATIQTNELDSREIDTSLIEVNAQISAYETLIAGMEESIEKTSMEETLKKYRLKKSSLERNKESKGAIGFLQKQNEIVQLEKAIVELDDLITQVKERMLDFN